MLALPVFVLEMGSHLIPGMHEWVIKTIGLQQSWYWQFALTLLVLTLPGRRFYLKGFPALARLAPGHELAGRRGNRSGIRLLAGGDLYARPVA